MPESHIVRQDASLESMIYHHICSTPTTLISSGIEAKAHRQDVAFLSNLALAQYPPHSSCPVACSKAGLNPSNWTFIHDSHSLRLCNATSLFDINIYTPVEGPKARISLRACGAAALDANSATPQTLTAGSASLSSCDVSSQSIKTTRDVQFLQWAGDKTRDFSANAVSAATELSRLLQEGDNCEQGIFLSQSKDVIVGVYIGSDIQRASAVDILQNFGNSAPSGPVKASQLAAQACENGNKTAQTLGVFADATGNLASVLNALQVWDKGQCLTGADNQQVWSNTPINVLNRHTTVRSDNTTIAARLKTKVLPRDTCTYVQAIANDGCWSLAQRCNITQAELQQYNSDPNFCNDIAVGQYVCCSPGSLPDFSPQPNPDGSCATYSIQTNDTCSAIAAANSMTVTQLESRNSDVWGWSGCQSLYIGQVICLSTGTPPMPAPIANAVCGPQVPNTTAPANMSDLASLNPCPLNACCDIWGQCGITTDFCIADPADTGAPGTAQPGTNGCISNCGMDIVGNGSPPSEFMRLGYYEAWNFQRPCLHMSVNNIDTSVYTHVHFAFGGITYDYQIDMSAVQGQFQQFRSLTGTKRIVSFGGWAFSTQPSTFNILRTASVVNNNLDGVDFDWEYPGAPDIPGIPAGSPDDGPNYLAFLQELRSILPSGKTISIAAPASFWYLKAFPIAEISQVVDYIVCMTYDLHGQWDYNNAFSDPGCPGGNCLRSQVNKTETVQSLAMITKAGVPASKILVGMALYGRSFQMTEAGCYTADCTYTGPMSGATPGECTDTAGYLSNYEIEQIIAGGGVQQYSSDDGDILVYNQTQWVSWMNPSTYWDRLAWVQGLNFGGTSDWAMDLNQTFADADASNIVYISPDIWSEPDPTVACYPPCTFVFPPWSLSTPTTISRPPVTMTLEETWPLIESLNGNITTTGYTTGTTVTTITLPPVTTDLIQVWNYEWTDTEIVTVYITSSVPFPPILLTEDSPPTQTQISTGTPFWYTYSPDPYPPYTGPSQTSSPTSIIPPPPPPPGSPGSVHVTQGPPSPTPRPGNNPKNGHICTANCIPEPPCLICGCIGPGCRGGGHCIGRGCSSGGGSNGGGDDTNSCSTSHTADICTEYISSYSSTGMDSSSTITQTACRTTTACEVLGTTITTTITTNCPACTLDPPAPDYTTMAPDPSNTLTWTIPAGDKTITGDPASPTPSFISCDFYGEDPDRGITSQYCVCSGSTFAPSSNTIVTPPNSCAYTTLPTNTVAVTTLTVTTTDTAICSACTAVGLSETCTSLPNCTPIPATTTTTTTTTSKPAPTKTSATCQITGWADLSEVVGSGGPGQTPVYNDEYGFIVGYKNGPTLGGISGDSVDMHWQTLDGKSLGLPEDIMWVASWDVNFEGCSASYEGVEYHGSPVAAPGGLGEVNEQCVVDFKCEPNLTPVTSNNEGPT
ncbi:hypothetical protein KXW08_003740 [Aspergillus fumigatus]|nr:hypothetical protein KXW08_003740 [Aspergillus fumigatus]